MLNKVQLIGNIGKDPEIRHLDGGNMVCNFTVATSESYSNKQGERITNTEWHNIVCWNQKTNEFIEKYLSKGDRVFIEGKIQTRSWDDRDGNKRYITEIVIPVFGGQLLSLANKREREEQRIIDGTNSEVPEELRKDTIYNPADQLLHTGSQPEEEEDDLPF